MTQEQKGGTPSDFLELSKRLGLEPFKLGSGEVKIVSNHPGIKAKVVEVDVESAEEANDESEDRDDT